MKHHHHGSGSNTGEVVDYWHRRPGGVRDSSSETSNSEEPAPAYSPASKTEAQWDITQTCCALRKFDWGIREFDDYHCLSQQSQKLRFQLWVAYCRTPAQKIPNLERLSCPLLWCRKSFDEHEKLVDHVSNCPFLREGRYWCPYCQRAEAFAEPEGRHLNDPSPSHKHHGKHMLKEAVNALRKFGSKSLRMATHPARSLNGQEKRWSKKQNKADGRGLLQELMSETHILELESREESPTHSPSAPKHSSKGIAELADDFFPVEMEAFCPAELDSDMMSCPSLERNTTGFITPESDQSPISPISPTEQQWLGYKCKDFESPISPTDTSAATSSDHSTSNPDAAGFPSLGYVFSFEEVLAGKAPQKEALAGEWDFAMIPIGGPLNGTSKPPSIRINTAFTHDDTMVWQSNGANEDPAAFGPNASNVNGASKNPPDTQSELSPVSPIQVDSELPSPVKYVEDLRDGFHILFEESVRKICQSPMSPSAASLIKANPSASFVFENGLYALKNLLRQVLPNTFWQVLGLSHLAYTVAVLGNHHNMTDQFRRIFTDIQTLANAITPTEDRVAFQHLAQEIWAPEAQRDNMSMDDGIATPQEHGRLASSQPLLQQAIRLSPPVFPQSCESVLFPASSSTTNQEIELIDSLKKGTAVDLCLRYLDSFEYASIRQGQLTTAALEPGNIRGAFTGRSFSNRSQRIMRDTITGALFKEHGLEGFHPVCIGAEKWLSGPKEVGLRELELKLVQDGRELAGSRDLYLDFVKMVRQLCDRASYLVGREFAMREDYYVHDIDKILEIHYSIRKAIQGSTRTSQTVVEQNHPVSAGSSEMPTNDERKARVSPQHLLVTKGSASSNTIGGPSYSSLRHFDATMIHTPNVAELKAVFPVDDYLMTLPASTDTISTRTFDPYTTIQTPVEVVQPSIPTAVAVEPGSVTCPKCSKVLRGNILWLPSNLQRHMREKHSPGARRLQCKESGCGRTFSRNHNLRVHMANVHGDSSVRGPS